MSDLLGIGSSALLAYRSALNVVGQNIANANTAGYSRQRIDLAARSLSGGAVANGDGVSVRSIQRLSDQFVFSRMVSQDSSLARISTFSAQATSVDSWLSGTNTGLSSSMQGFFDSVNSLGSSASSSATRQVVLSGAAALSSRFNDLQNNFNAADGDVDARLADTTSQVNLLAKQVATLNERIAQATAANAGELPNELMDQRDIALRSLATQVGISTTTTDDGSVNVTLGSGQALVLGTRAATLDVVADAYGRPRALVLNGGGAPVTVTQQVSGGTLGGLLDFRREVLEPAMNQLGTIASALSSAINAQHAEGMDQYGEMGGALFTVPTGTTTPARTNTGTATLSASIGDIGALTSQDYTLSYDGASWKMSDAGTGAPVALSGSGTAADPLVANGVKLVLGGSAQAGDQFLVQPTRNAAGQFKLAISDPARLAAASPLRTSAGTGNSGLSSIGAPEVLDAGNPNLLQTTTIAFTSASTYTINGSGSYTLASDGAIAVNGWSAKLGGIPASGDSFTLSRNDGASGDNSNALALAAVANQGLLSGGRNTLAAANSALVSAVGSQASQASTQLDAQTSLSTQTQAERDSVSGVNLDEEAADLIRFQQAYQAAAQIVSAANTLFDSLLSAVRG
ncbi:MAG: flgK [Hydrocarboniphaga sp.]|uniref:flagellar hook-associated protein FlgK n=1 Tax=Hydrocarboniphaga sp. TaxID=2033016 RepID=UPI002614D520|nr:flagellar hook-associated protein FlgK [Hydrocarboniphaga sp.]MDB5967587.1 flgK [Hydrocarboniphaga sp.]